MYPQILIDACRTHKTLTLSRSKKPEVLELKTQIIDATKFLDDVLSEVFMVNRTYCIINGITEVPKCGVCDRHVSFFTENHNKGFNEYCSSECRKTVPRISGEVEEKLNNYDWLFEQRITKRMSSRSVGAILGVSDATVNRYCDRLNIPKTQYNASDDTVTKFLDDYDWLYKKHKTEHMALRDIGSLIGTSMSTVGIALKKHGIDANDTNSYDRDFQKTSIGERELLEFIKSIYSGKIVTGSRSVLGDNREIDIFIPEMNLAFEYNGVFRHAYYPEGDSYSLRKDSTYHKSKTDLCESKGIHLIQIWSSSWQNKKDIWKSRIKTKFGIVERKIYARNCSIEEIPVWEKNTFLDENHIQGRDKSSYKFGLFYKNELVSVMTFSKSRYNKNVDWELVRFATKKNTIVVGGFSKMLKHFRIKHYGSIISYADRMHSDGHVYEKNGFCLEAVSKASYHYFKGDETLLHRQNFMKSKISNGPEDKRTEHEIMKENGYRWVYDCGIKTYILK